MAKKETSDVILNKIIGYWNSLGKPFAKAKPNSDRTIVAKKILSKLYRRHRGKIFDAMDRGHKHMSSNLFIYRPAQNISIREFLRTTAQDRRYNKVLDTLGITSWFRIFLIKTDAEIYNKYYIITKDKYPDITEAIKNIVSESQGHDRYTPYDNKNLIITSQLVNILCNENDIYPRTVIATIKRILSDIELYSTRMLISERFWNVTVPKELVRYGDFKSIREIKKIEI